MRILLDECVPASLVLELAGRNKIEFLRRLLPELRHVLPSVQPGQVYRVGV